VVAVVELAVAPIQQIGAQVSTAGVAALAVEPVKDGVPTLKVAVVSPVKEVMAATTLLEAVTVSVLAAVVGAARVGLQPTQHPPTVDREIFPLL